MVNVQCVMCNGQVDAVVGNDGGRRIYLKIDVTEVIIYFFIGKQVKKMIVIR